MAEILWPGYVWQKYIRRDRGMYGRGNGNSRGIVAAICVYAFLSSVGFAPFAKDHLNFPKHQCCYPSTIFTTVGSQVVADFIFINGNKKKQASRVLQIE